MDFSSRQRKMEWWSCSAAVAITVIARLQLHFKSLWMWQTHFSTNVCSVSFKLASVGKFFNFNTKVSLFFCFFYTLGSVVLCSEVLLCVCLTVLRLLSHGKTYSMSKVKYTHRFKGWTQTMENINCNYNHEQGLEDANQYSVDAIRYLIVNWELIRRLLPGNWFTWISTFKNTFSHHEKTKNNLCKPHCLPQAAMNRMMAKASPNRRKKKTTEYSQADNSINIDGKWWFNRIFCCLSVCMWFNV